MMFKPSSTTPTNTSKQGLPIPGVVLVPNPLAIGLAVNDLEIAIGAGQPEDFKDRVTFIPLS